MSVTQAEFRKALGCFATGVTVITVDHEGEVHGMTANSLTSVSLDPPMLLWCLASSSPSIVAFEEGMKFAVHILAHHQGEFAKHFARRLREKFEVDRHWRSNPHPPHLANTLCRFDCSVHSVTQVGDHRIIVGQVFELTRHAGEPLVFHQGRFGSFTSDRGSPHVDPWDDWRGEWF